MLLAKYRESNNHYTADRRQSVARCMLLAQYRESNDRCAARISTSDKIKALKSTISMAPQRSGTGSCIVNMTLKTTQLSVPSYRTDDCMFLRSAGHNTLDIRQVTVGCQTCCEQQFDKNQDYRDRPMIDMGVKHFQEFSHRRSNWIEFLRNHPALIAPVMILWLSLSVRLVHILCWTLKQPLLHRESRRVINQIGIQVPGRQRETSLRMYHPATSIKHSTRMCNS